MRNLQASFWGNFEGQTRQRLKELLESDADQQVAEYLGLKLYERVSEPEQRVNARNGFYERNYLTDPDGVSTRQTPALLSVYQVENAAGARRAFERSRFRWRSHYPAMVR